MPFPVVDAAAIGVIAILLAVAFVFARVAQHSGLPPAAALLLVGIAAGGIVPHEYQIALTPATLALFLPVLIFDGAWDLDARILRQTALQIAILALPGVIITAALIALAAGLGARLPLAAALALGALLSATDPVAVLALLRHLTVPVALRTLIEGESIANDGVAVVIVGAVVAFAAGVNTSPAALVVQAAYVSCGGMAAGIAVAALVAPLLRTTPLPPLRMFLTVVVAYGAYTLASSLHASGIFASAAAGIALPMLAVRRSDDLAMDRFWDRLAFLANAIVFLLVGFSLKLDRIFHEPLLFIATVAGVIVSRAILAYALVPLRRLHGFVADWRHAIALTGIRGGLSLALALGLPAGFPSRPQIIDAVFAIVFLTIVIQGWALAPALQRLRLQADP